MALNFTTSMEKYTTASTSARATDFTQYASKKQLAQAGALNDEALEFLLAIKNTFTFAVHNEKQYVAVTLYYASTKSYGFIVVDLHNKAVAEVASIKEAKTEIRALVNAQ
jgi:hypothetical protein